MKSGNVRSVGNGNPGFKDGTATETQFYYPSGITQSESDGSLLVSEEYNHKIRKITFEGIPPRFLLRFTEFLCEGEKINVKTIVEQPNANNNTSLKCDLQNPLAIYLDNKTKICYFTTFTSVFKFYNSP